MEWLGGRFALKELVRQTLGAPLKDIEILPHASGKPVLSAGGKPCTLAFSITHSRGWAVAAVSADEPFVGIDLEKQNTALTRGLGIFSPFRTDRRGGRFLTALWTQKEALVKLLGTGLSLNSYDVRCVDGKPAFSGRR